MAYYAVPSTDSASVLRNSAETLTINVYADETLTGPSAGSLTVGIVDEAGATVVAAGTSTTSSSTGVFSYALAAQADLGLLTATWSATFGSALSFTTQHQIVGGYYTSPVEVRSMDSISGESATFPTADLVESITWASDVIDDYTGASWVYRYERDVLDGTGTDHLKLSKMFPRTLLAASVGGTALTSSQLADIALRENGVIVRGDGVWNWTEPGRQVVVAYEHGVQKTPPADIAWAAKTLARYHLIEQVSRIPDRALSISSEFGNIQLAQPGMNRPTPLPDVNVILNRHRHRAPVAF